MLDRLATRLATAALRLPPARTRRVTLTRGIPVRVRDGVPLRTDHYAPALPDAPTVLIRTPYGRGGPMRLLGRLVAERGFHVVIQSCRGTFGSGGTFAPLVHEREDGLDTLDWLRRQPWWSGAFGMFGASYQGFVQWALAADAGEELRAMVAVVTASGTRDSTYAGESFALDTVLTWAELLQAQTVPWLARQWELSAASPGWSRRWPTCRWPRRTGSPPASPCRSSRSGCATTPRTPSYWRTRGLRRPDRRGPRAGVDGRAAGTTSSCRPSCATTRRCARPAPGPS